MAAGLAGITATTITMHGPAANAAVGSGWTETSTGQVMVTTVAQPGPRLTWAAGAAVTTEPDSGVTTFTPALYARDLSRGGTWRRAKLAGATSWNSRINDIATPADGSAFFVGDQSTDGKGILVGRYTGGAWSLTADTSLPEEVVDASLLSVSAASGQDAWAVGQGYEQETWTQVPVVQRWNGNRWRPVHIPGSANWSLTQVDEVAPSDVWVVGVDNSTGQSVATHWDGSRWKRAETPKFPDSSVLFDVVARTPSDIWAVGWSRETDKQRPAGLALHWDGAAWSEVPLPAGTFGLQSATLRPEGGIAVVGGGDDGAVGLGWTPGAGWQPLGLPENDPQHPLGANSAVSSGTGLTVAGWHYTSSDEGDSFLHGAILTS